MRSMIVAIVIVFALIIVKSNAGYFEYDGSARSSDNKTINYQVGQ